MLVPISALAISDIKLSENEQRTFARSCKTFLNQRIDRVRETSDGRDLDLSSALGADPKPSYKKYEFMGDEYKYFSPQYITSTLSGAHFETTILASIRVDYKGDGWTLKNKTERFERPYTCLSVSEKRGIKPKVIATYFKDTDGHNTFYNMDGYWISFDGLGSCKDSCGVIRSFVTKHDK